jgi:hypothetical protein
MVKRLPWDSITGENQRNITSRIWELIHDGSLRAPFWEDNILDQVVSEWETGTLPEWRSASHALKLTG